MPLESVVLALEYRSVANAYLSRTKTPCFFNPSDIRMSPLEEVNQMLVADKVQNYKDFLLYHKDRHPRSKKLDRYFNNWFEVLGVNYGKIAVEVFINHPMVE